MKISKGQLLEILRVVDDDPQLFSQIILDLFKRLPDAAAWTLAQQLYVEYFWDGPIVVLTDNITGISRDFTGPQDISVYLRGLGYSTSKLAITDAINNHLTNYCNHSFKIKERD